MDTHTQQLMRHLVVYIITNGIQMFHTVCRHTHTHIQDLMLHQLVHIITTKL